MFPGGCSLLEGACSRKCPVVVALQLSRRLHPHWSTAHPLSVPQVLTLVYYVASYFPGGASGAQTIIGGMGRGGLSIGGAVLRSVFS